MVVRALRCNGGLRLLSGFLTLFMAFLLRESPLPGWEDRPELLLGAGHRRGRGRQRRSASRSGRCCARSGPAYVVVLVLVADTVAAVVAAVLYSLPAVMLLGLVAGLSQALGKLSLDSLIQSEVPERTRSSAFARSETLLQLSWVVGGFLGIAMPLIPRLGLGVLAVILVGDPGLGADLRCAEPVPPPRRLTRRSLRRPATTSDARRAVAGQDLELVGQRAQQHGGRLGRLGVGVAPGAVAAARCPRAAGRGPRRC